MRLTVSVLFVLMAAPIEAAPPQDVTVDYPTLWERAVAAYRAREPEKTVDLLHEIVRRTPRRVDAWVGLSRAHEWAGSREAAIEAGERAHELAGSGDAQAAYRLARLHAEAGNAEAALEWLERALEERFEDRPEIAADEAFAALRENERFRRLAGIPPGGEATRAERWRFDLAYLVEEAERMHADPARPAFDAPFKTAAAALREEIPRLSDDEIYLRMMALLAILNDGHTAIYSPAEGSPAEINRRLLPFKFYWFPEGLYVTDGVGEWAEFAGHRVVRFGDLDAEKVLRRMAVYRGVDNSMTWRWMGPQFYVGRLVLLQAVGATPGDEMAAEAVEMTLEGPGGEIRRLAVGGGEYRIQRKLRPSPAAAGETPLWLSNVGTNYWLRPMPDRKALYFQFNQVRDAEDESIAEFAERLRAELSGGDVETLIVDVRHNNGGNNFLVRPLVRALVEFEMGGPDRKIFVLTGRNTFSAAQNFINRVEQWTDATFAGEPSASSPNFVGEETNLLLPYSRIRGSISTRFWQDSSPGDGREWIPMDIPVDLRAADYFAGRDPVLGAVGPINP